MKVFWLQQADANVPPENNWLTPDELRQINGMRFAKRRQDYRLGRWTAKLAVATYLGWLTHFDVLADIAIKSAPSGAPTVRIRGEAAQLVISISHRSGRAMCSVGNSGTALGCDLELVESRSEAFVRDYFTSQEQKKIYSAFESDRDRLVTFFWSAKESALKALQEGLRLDTRSVVVRLLEAEEYFGKQRKLTSDRYPQLLDTPWNPFDVTRKDGSTFQGWSQYADNFVRTIVSTSPCAPPISLTSGVMGRISTGVADQALLERMLFGAGP
jgi:4'-phosphopantetheinyl transferase